MEDGSGLAIHVLGAPTVVRGGVRQSAPRGRKVWGLLVYLLLSERTVRREDVAQLLFAEADDPLGALRWNLAELRRLLGLPDALTGSTLRLDLPGGVFVDVRALRSGGWAATLELSGLGQELLAGMTFDGSPAFEVWLVAQRQHLQAQAEAVLHEAALARLGVGDTRQAIALTTRLLGMNPYDENYHELLIRSHGVAGDRAGAARQLAACVALFTKELGVEPGPAVYAAADATGVSATATAATGRAAARAQLDAGEAAIGAGAIEAGLECLRRAVAEAHACGDLGLKARALLALGSALTHAARGRDEEAAAALHEAAAIAVRDGSADVTGRAHLELAWIEMLQGRYARAFVQMETSRQAAGDTIYLSFLEGTCRCQVGRYGEGLALLRAAVPRAEAENDQRTLVQALGQIGLMQFMMDDREAARAMADRCIAGARALSWTAYLPFPEALLGILDVVQHDWTRARDRLEHSFALGCQLRDCCWEGMAAGGLALIDQADGNVGGALERFESARRRSVREPDAWLWGYAFVTDLACAFAVRHHCEVARTWVDDLETLAARTMMKEFLTRARLYRHELGDPDALAAAELGVAEVDNPALHQRVAAIRASGRASPV